MYVLLVLLSALFLGIADIISKSVLTKRHSMEFNAAKSLLTIFFLIFLIPFVWEPISLKALLIIYVISIIFSIEIHLFSRALRHLDISVAAPLMELSPLFLLVLAVLFLDEALTPLGVTGVLLLTIGAFLINLDFSKSGFMNQMLQFAKSKYVHLVLLAALAGAVVAILQKTEVASTRPLVLGFYLWLFISVNLLAYYLFSNKWKDIAIELRDYGAKVLIIAVLGVASSLFYLQALPLALVSLIVPLRRISALISVVAGGNLFAEKHVLLRTIATVIMILGTVLILV